VITKLDVLDNLDWIPVCTAYEVDGKTVRDDAGRHPRDRGNPARVHSAEGMEDVDRRGPEFRRTSQSGAGVSAFHGKGIGREDRHRSTGPDRDQTLELPEFRAAMQRIAGR